MSKPLQYATPEDIAALEFRVGLQTKVLASIDPTNQERFYANYKFLEQSFQELNDMRQFAYRRDNGLLR